MNKYFIYHAHSTYSKMDSTMQIEDYTAKVKEMGHTSICYSEHGVVSNWIKKKQLADKAGLKYVHAVEAYLCSATKDLEGKKIRENMHVILIAKNYAGVLEINELVTLSS
ncbi:MAG: PHP domain-containing protein, partial [Paraclostridium sp.]